MVFVVMHSGRLHFPSTELEKVYGTANGLGGMWAAIYRVTTRENTWIVYYGEEVLGYSYVRFVHSKDEALSVAKKWMEDREV